MSRQLIYPHGSILTGRDLLTGGAAATKSAFNLLGGYVEYDVDFSGVPPGMPLCTPVLYYSHYEHIPNY